MQQTEQHFLCALFISEHTSSSCAVCVETGIAIMTGNYVSALPLGLMGMHKSAWSLCSQLSTELREVTVARPRMLRGHELGPCVVILLGQ